MNWYNEINKLDKGKAAEWVRFFAVPGMTHCGGGPSTDQFDAFDALVNWVEKKTPPDRIVATAGPMTAWPGRTRPLCPYPQYARYSGKGSIEEASNFVCKRRLEIKRKQGRSRDPSYRAAGSRILKIRARAKRWYAKIREIRHPDGAHRRFAFVARHRRH